MSKNFADLYNSTNDSIALEQRFFLKVEATPGTLIAPTATDFLRTLPGGSISFNQPFESSTRRSGRHHLDIIKKKKENTFTLKTYWDIDTTLGSKSVSEIDLPVRGMLKSLFGNEDTTSGGVVYTVATQWATTFSLFENGDRWARQARGCFINDASMNFPGDGEATVDWTGAGKDSLYAGIGYCTTMISGTNVFSGSVGDGDQFDVGSLVMIVKSDGVTRSTDTAVPRTVTAVNGDDITLSGAALTTDSDGPSYLVYWEPATVTAINNPQTGLVGSATFTGLNVNQAVRAVTLKLSNNHELVNYRYGTDALASPFFIPGNRLTCETSVEMNLNRDTFAFFKQVKGFSSKDLTFVLGDSSSRYMQALLPNIKFPVPAFTVPDTGSIPITFTGNAYETADDAADEITISFL